MIASSANKKPKIHSSAYVAPTAVVSGDVTIGAGCAILHGAVVTAEGAPVTIGADCVIMELAVVKASGGTALQFPTTIEDRCIIGPHAFVVGAEIGAGSHVGSGAKIYNTVKLPPNSAVAANETLAPEGNFFETVFNIAQSDDAASQAAQSYARFLRKAHAQDSVLADHAQAPIKRRAGEEPPPQQIAEVEGVVDAMMLELQEMELRRQEALKKKPKR